MEKIVKL
jgi:hypothetical protein